MTDAAGATNTISRLLDERLARLPDAAVLNATAAELRRHADTDLAQAAQAALDRIPLGMPAQAAARDIIAFSLLIGSIKAPHAHRGMLRDGFWRLGRSLADLPNQTERAPAGWYAADVHGAARRHCLALAAREAQADPALAKRLLDFIPFDDSGVLSPFAAAMAEAPDSTEALALGFAGLDAAGQRARLAPHADIAGLSLTGGVPILHAGDCPPGLRRALPDEQRPLLSAPGPAPELWWWLESGWPPQQERRPTIMIQRVPGFVRDMLKAGQARILLNCGHEISFVDAFFAAMLRRMAELLGCDPARIVYVAQNPNVVERYAEVAMEASGGQPSVVCAGNSHLLLPWTNTPSSTEARRPRRFLCFNNIPHVFRAALLLRMVRDGIDERGFVSFNWGFTAPLPPGSEPITTERLRPYFPELEDGAIAALMAEVEPRLPLRLDLGGTALDSHGRGAHVEQFSGDLTAQAYFTVVTESDMEWPDHTRRFTEKTVKPLASCNPFILFGNAGVLAALRGMGFETFGDVIDEGYDAIANPVERFEAAYAQLRRISAMSLDEHAMLYERLRPRLEHNRRHLSGAQDWYVGGIRAAIDAAARA